MKNRSISLRDFIRDTTSWLNYSAKRLKIARHSYSLDVHK
jgi:hypothetical protein